LLQMSRLWDRYPGVAGWWQRVSSRASVQESIMRRMTESDWAPFRSIEADPWPKVSNLLAAA
jgi:hypothetical protein